MNGVSVKLQDYERMPRGSDMCIFMGSVKRVKSVK